MELWLLITTAIISALISGLVSYFFYTRQKETDQRFEYRKYILDKRKKVYDEIELILGEITTEKMVPVVDGEGNFLEPLWGPGFMVKGNEHDVEEFLAKILKVMNYSYWISDDMFVQLNELNIFVLDLQSYLIERAKEVPFFNKMHGAKTDMIYFAEKMSNIYFVDICELDDIEKFKKKKYVNATSMKRPVGF